MENHHFSVLNQRTFDWAIFHSNGSGSTSWDPALAEVPWRPMIRGKRRRMMSPRSIPQYGWTKWRFQGDFLWSIYDIYILHITYNTYSVI